MKTLNLKKDGAVLGALILTALLTLALSYSKKSLSTESQATEVPRKIGAWQGEDVPVDEKTFELLETRNVLMRQYSAPGKASVLLCIVYSNENRKVSHPPEVCYQGDGFEILGHGKTSTPLAEWRGKQLKANQMVVERKGNRQSVLYWYKAGSDYTDNYLQQQWRALWSQVARKGGGCALIRLSTPVAADEAEGLQDLILFGRELLPALDEKLI